MHELSKFVLVKGRVGSDLELYIRHTFIKMRSHWQSLWTVGAQSRSAFGPVTGKRWRCADDLDDKRRNQPSHDVQRQFAGKWSTMHQLDRLDYLAVVGVTLHTRVKDVDFVHAEVLKSKSIDAGTGTIAANDCVRCLRARSAVGCVSRVIDQVKSDVSSQQCSHVGIWRIFRVFLMHFYSCFCLSLLRLSKWVAVFK